MSSNRHLQPLNNVQINAKANVPQGPITKTPIKGTGSVTKPEKRKKKEKLSSLCKTPPSIVKNRHGRGYRRGHFLGEGGFARCFQMKDDTGRTFAAKTVAKASIKNEKTKTKLLSEIKIHKSMSHPNIVEFIDCFEDDVNVYILLEICPNQSLMDLLKHRKLLSEPETRFFMVQIIGAIKYLHRRRVVHRDLKLGNIFFDPNMDLKIGDFGLATIISQSQNKRYTICGTPNYIAPEVLGGKSVGHSFEVDTWAIGIMLFALLFGKPPFQAKDVQIIYDRIKKNEYQFPEGSEVSDEARILISDLLSTDPLDRPSLDEILEYDWFKCGPFPANITIETLKQQPKELAFITKEQSFINFANAKQRVGINDSIKNPVEILKTDLQSERPKALLPHSLSPDNTKNKYKEVSPVNITPYKKDNIGDKLANAHSEDKVINILNNCLSTTLDNIEKITTNQMCSTTSSTASPTLISKWVDYSNKHGFAYQLSTGAIGVLFKEGHTVLKSGTSGVVYLIHPDNKEGWHSEMFSPHDIPKNLTIEMQVVNFFEKYMNQHLCEVHGGSNNASRGEVFLRRYHRDDNGVMFELSNGSYQFNFKDHHKLVVSDYGHTITHIAPNKQIETLPLDYVHNEGNFYATPDEYFQVKFDFIKHNLKSKIM
ncbi:polo kinase [Martiniozyma asiatica (nom. inval.)]|nr:polo kinase [Martiniozyma asiatica]